MNMVAWLLALCGPMVIRALIALGFTAITLTGVTVAANALLVIAQNNWSALPVAILQLCNLSGIPQCLGMIAGAYMARVAVWAAVNGTKYILKAA